MYVLNIYTWDYDFKLLLCWVQLNPKKTSSDSLTSEIHVRFWMGILDLQESKLLQSNQSSLLSFSKDVVAIYIYIKLQDRSKRNHNLVQ